MTITATRSPLSLGEIDLVRDSFVEVLLAPDRAATIFYDRMFALAPDTRVLFRKDLGEQGRVLIATLAKVVTGLAHLDAMLPTLAALAIRHVDYGARPHHYAVVGDALLHMIDCFVGTADGSPTRMAWTRAYHQVADAMIAAAYPCPTSRHAESS